MKVRAVAWIALCIALTTQKGMAEKTVTSRPVAQGVELIQEITTGASPLRTHILSIKLGAPGIQVKNGQSFDSISLRSATRGRESLQTLAKRHQAVAGVNADFFPFTGDPLGLAIRDGELLSEPMSHRVCFGLRASGEAVMDVLTAIASLRLADSSETPIGGINRLPAPGEITIVTPIFAATPKAVRPVVVISLREVNLPVKVSQETQGTIEMVSPLEAGETLPACRAGYALIVADSKTGEVLAGRCKPGDRVSFRFELASSGPPPARGRLASRAANLRATGYAPIWTDIEQAVGGGPWLVRNGEVAVDGEAEGFEKASFTEARHPRTAVGVTADKRLLLVAVDGRQASSRGLSLPEIAALMKRLGAVNAINLDGGGSTAMYVAGGIVNAPSDGRVRPIANALLVFGTPLDIALAGDYRIEPVLPGTAVPLTVGELLNLTIREATQKPIGTDLPILWGTDDGLGFVTQQGVFTSYRPGKGKVTARVGSALLEYPIEVAPGPFSQLKATLTAVMNTADKSLLTVTSLDAFGNAVGSQSVTLSFAGGRMLTLVTNEKGQATQEVTWQANETEVTLKSGSAPPITLRKSP